MATLNSRIHVSFVDVHTPIVNINLEKAFKLIRRNGRRGAFKHLTRRQSHTTAKLFLANLKMREIPISFQKDFAKFCLKTNIKPGSFKRLDTTGL